MTPATAPLAPTMGMVEPGSLATWVTAAASPQAK